MAVGHLLKGKKKNLYILRLEKLTLPLYRKHILKMKRKLWNFETDMFLIILYQARAILVKKIHFVLMNQQRQGRLSTLPRSLCKSSAV